MDWDWSAFVPTLLATLSGVILSVVLSLGVYRLVSWHREKSQAEQTRQALLEECKANEKTLQEHIEYLKKEAKQGRQGLSLTILSRLETSAYDAACHGNRVRLLGDVSVQKDLVALVEDWRFFNLLLQRCEDIAIHDLVYAPPEKASKLLGIWDGLVMQKAEEFLSETTEVRQRLEAVK